MNYEQRYKEALEKAKGFWSAEYKGIVEEIFPELKESEDERIRKWIINDIQSILDAGEYNTEGVKDAKKAIAWLKKQKQKPIVLDIDKMVDDYANSSERGNEEFGKPVNCMIRAYRQGLNDAIGKIVLKPGEWNAEDERLCSSCINHIEEELERIRNDKYGHSEIISDLKESCRERIGWLESLKQRMEK